jgi:hypothetical protein
MKNEVLSNFIDLIYEMEAKQEEINNALESSTDILGNYCSKIEQLILDEAGLPKDNTLEMIEKYGDPDGYFHEETFCRDIAISWFIDYENEEITKEKLIFKLLNWEKEYRDSSKKDN